MRKLTVALVVAVAFLATFAGTSDSASIAVDIGDNFFNPQAVTINVGDTVVWTNRGFAPHTSTSGSSCPSTDGKWDSGVLSNGGSFSHTFTQAGTFPYFCTIHCFTGTVTVAGNLPQPSAAQFFPTYGPIAVPVVSTDPAQAQPIAVGSAATGGGFLSLQVETQAFAGPVDLYFLLYIPSFDAQHVYLWTGTTFVRHTDGLAPWKTAVTGPISESLFGDVPLSDLHNAAAGEWVFGLLATPPGDKSLTLYYLWGTILTL